MSGNGKNKRQLVSIIVPAYNEELLISGFLKEVRAVSNKIGINYEVLVVENGSKDNTKDILVEFAKRDSRIRVFHLGKASYGLALFKGLKEAKGEYIVIFNVDFWDERFLRLPLIDMLGYDLITASKLLPGSNDLRGFNRRLVSKLFNKFLNIFLGYKGTDTHGIKLLRSRTVSSVIKECKITSGVFDSELLIRAQRKSLKILELPVEVKELRSARFGLKRIMQTPTDILDLYLSLK